MRIGIDSRMLGGGRTGIGRYTLSLIRHLVKTDTENQYIIISNKENSELLEKNDNLKVLRVEYPPLSLYTLFRLHRKIKKEKIDLYHSPFFLAPLMLSSPLIITVHDLMGLKFPDFFEGGTVVVRLFARWFIKLFVPLALKRAKKIIAVSETTKKELVENLNISEDKIEVIYQGVDSFFRKESNPQRREKIKSDFKINKGIILYIGNTRSYKNLPRLIKAFQIFQEEVRGFQLVIGSGDKRNMRSLNKMISHLNLKQDVIFTGPLKDEDIITLMSSAEVFVFPSLWEGFGLPPLEAMACGLPVVASRAGSLPEVLEDAAYLVNPENEEDIANGIKEVLTNNALRKHLIQKGLERVKLFFWEKTARETLGVYKVLVK